MRCERIASLARVLQGKAANYNNTHSAQWLERSLDDSACVSNPLYKLQTLLLSYMFCLANFYVAKDRCARDVPSRGLYPHYPTECD